MIRIGIIGAGPNATGHGKYYHQSERAEVAAIADPDLDRAKTLADLTSAKAVKDYTEFLDDVDAVVVSSPNFLHKDHAIACAQAGKHVYCEKPMGLSLGDAEEIAEAIEKAGVASAVGFSVSKAGVVQTMMRLVREGRIGDVISIWSRRLTYLDSSKHPGWRQDHSRSGGLLLEINIHEIEWIMKIGGEVESVYAQLRATDSNHPRNNDHIFATLNFANHAVGTHEGSWKSAAPSYFKGVHGTKGAVSTGEWGNPLFFNELGTNRSEIESDADFDLRANFLDAIEGKAESFTGAPWGLKVMRVAEAIYESARLNQVVQVNDLVAGEAVKA